jgi:hypothetical protein
MPQKRNTKASGNDNDSPTLMLTLEGKGKVICAKQFSWVSDGLIGCVAFCTDGSGRLFAEVEHPTESQFYGFDESIHTLPFEEKKQRVCDVTGLDERDELPWLEYDEVGNPIEGQVEAKLLEAWLLKTITFDDERYYTWGSRTASQYAPGFEIMNILNAADRENLGLYQVDLGGPGSTVPCVAMTASIDRFNQIMKVCNLPYIMVDDEGPNEA